MEVKEGRGGLPTVVLTSSCGASAEVILFGGAVTSWKQASGDEVLYIRPDAVFDKSKPVSGGIPHCFPQVSAPPAAHSEVPAGAARRGDAGRLLALLAKRRGPCSGFSLISRLADGRAPAAGSPREQALWGGRKPPELPARVPPPPSYPHCAQFGPGKIQQHGFARNLDWAIGSSSADLQPDERDPEVELVLTDNDYTRAMW